LATQSFPDSSSTPASQAPPPEGLPGKIFLNDEGLRSGWSLLIYAAFWLMINFVAQVIVQQFIGIKVDSLSPQYLFLEEIASFASAYGAGLLMARLERRPVSLYGLPIQHAFGKSFWQGVLLGLGEVTVLMALIAAFGGYSFGRLAMHGASLLGWGVFWAVAFVFVGLSEEFLFRGYVQYTLARGIGFWPAAVLLSILFGFVHRGNPGEGIVGEANVAVTGLVFAFALRRTGNLWLAVGWHASFDFGETFLFSVPNSGVVYAQHLSTATLHGATWLTGGTIGPEGSVFSFLTLGFSALVIHLLFPAKRDKHPALKPGSI
jgi:membrane protease YdiL (CAAX protease family)